MNYIDQIKSNNFAQLVRDREALIDLIVTGMVQKLENGKSPRLSARAREAVKALTKERNKKLNGVAMRVSKSVRGKK